MIPIIVKAAFDPEVGRWYIEESSLSGLHVEADTHDELAREVAAAIEELLEGQPGEVPFVLITRQDGSVNIAA
jgi:predicted RNase H-like HicB family nuclease